LAALRKRARVTQRDLAQQLGKPQSFVSAYESGQRRIDVLELLLIVDALEGDARAVFDEIRERRTKRLRG
jgi:transcriptional regulator with XRE-family HTH domain